MNVAERIKKAVDVKQVLEYYGAQRIRGNGHLRSTCPIHGGDNPSALVFDENQKVWYCHTGCMTGGSVFHFVMKMDNLEFKEAAEKLAEMFNVEVDWTMEDIDEDEFADLAKDFIKDAKRREEAKKALPLYDPYFTRKTVKKYRNFSPEAIEHYGLQVATDGELVDRIVMPLEDQDNRLVGYSGRRIKADMVAKWMHKPNGLQLGKIVPGIGLNNVWIREKAEIIIVEGIFDCIRTWDYGYKHVATTMAANITDEQVRLIQMNAFTVILGYDNDLAGRNATRKAIEKMQHSLDMWILDIPEGSDPCELSKEEMDLAYQNKMKPYEFFERYGLKKEKGNA